MRWLALLIILACVPAVLGEHYVNLASTAGKLERLFDTFQFTTLGAVVRQMVPDPAGASLERAECPA